MTEQEQPIKFAAAIPVETSIDSDGERVRLEFVANSGEAVDLLKNKMIETYGGTMETINPKSQRSFGLSGVVWNSSWEPKGPKQNWSPRDPSLN